MIAEFILISMLPIFVFWSLKIDYRRTSLLDLGAHPDAIGYFAQARSLLKDGKPSIQIGSDKLPSRYPFGIPR